MEEPRDMASVSKPGSAPLPSPARGLGARLLAITVGLVLLGEVLIYVPSISRFRVQYLNERLASAHLATAVLLAHPDTPLDREMERAIMEQAGLVGVVVSDRRRFLSLGGMPPVGAVYRIEDETVPEKIVLALRTVLAPSPQLVRVIGPSPTDPTVSVDIVMDEADLCAEMQAYSGRILQLSLFLSALVAGSLFLLLQRLIVRPVRRLTGSVVAFRENPDDAAGMLPRSDRRDELGIVARETARMQRRIRAALRQRERLAALGSAVGKINHDLRNVLASAMLVSDRLEASSDPQVKKVAPRLIEALERATRLCAETLAFARSEPPELERERFGLQALVDTSADTQERSDPRFPFKNEVPPTLEVLADRDQLYRVFSNLFRNAREAMGERGGLIAVRAWRDEDDVVVEVADTGPGIAEAVRDHLFEAFVGTARPGGTGLGLHIARDIARRHGGDLFLHRTGADGTAFRLVLRGAA